MAVFFLVQAMVGRSLVGGLYDVSAKDRKRRKAGPMVLSVQNLSMQNIVPNNSFSVFGGQITGIFGLVGSGRTETAKIIAGVVKRDLVHGGEVKLEGRSVRYKVPKQAVKDGIIYVTEDRKTEGFFETMSIAQNIYMTAIVVISSYLPEILHLSDRILVSHQRRIVEEFNPEDATETMVMYAAVH